MDNDLRITGDNPSPDLLIQYPNWENALDEEDFEGQDETTLRPSEDQTVIRDDVPFTAATAWLNDGRECPAIIELIDDVSGVQLHLDGQWYRIVRSTDRFGQFERWEPYVEDWLPENERECQSLLLTDAQVFPMCFESRLPYHKTSSPIRIKIESGGGEETLS